MKRITIAAVALAALTCFAETAWAQNAADKYIQQTYRVSGVPASAEPMIRELRAEVQRILDAGPLDPLRAVYGDIKDDMYYMYWQGGRIVTTLAYAYPYLSDEQQAAVVKYVQAELADDNRAPWSPDGHIPPTGAARREIHSWVHKGDGWGRYWDMWGVHKPSMSGFYGLWLYADRTGDWETLKASYAKIVRLYSQNVNNCDIYGTFGAHIAMARIAEHFGDDKTARAASNATASALKLALNFDEVEKRAKKYYGERYEPRQRGATHNGWMFMELAPEIGRFIADNDELKAKVLQRNADALNRWPLFWLREATYSGARWTGDEGIGLPTELMGQIVPIRRWVESAPAADLASYTRSTPICIGDCYWLEMLVAAIEASGKTTWVQIK